MNQTSAQHETIPVLIIGGGLVGLSTSLFLSHAGVSSLMIERHPGTAIHPRAMGFSPRTLEMFRTTGVEKAIRKVEPSLAAIDGSTLLVESLVGQVFDNLQEDVSSIFTGPVPGSAIAQDLLEPLLRTRAEQLGGDLRFGNELVACEQDAEGVTATIRERESGRTYTVHAQFLVAADGSNSPLREQFGIGQHGMHGLFHSVSIIFEAELMEIFQKQHAIMCFLANDTVSGAMVPYPGSSARPDLFRLDATYDPEVETLDDYPEERCLALIRAAVGIPDFPVTRIRAVLTYEANALVADSFQQGRVFFVGYAARTQPPSGGLGGNTGIAEAHNLAWKLAAVLHGEAGETLLTTYDSERRTLADYTAEQVALLSQQRQNEGSAGITVDVVSVNSGYRYSAGAIVQEAGDELLPLAQRPEQWQGQPGTYAPYLAFEREGKAISTLDLFGTHFVLLTGVEGANWEAAAQHVREALHLSLDVYQIGESAHALLDREHRLCESYGISAGGAVLVRPDGFIAWRSKTGQTSEQAAEQTLTQVLTTILAR